MLLDVLVGPKDEYLQRHGTAQVLLILKMFNLLILVHVIMENLIRQKLFCNMQVALFF